MDRRRKIRSLTSTATAAMAKTLGFIVKVANVYTDAKPYRPGTPGEVSYPVEGDSETFEMVTASGQGAVPFDLGALAAAFDGSREERHAAIDALWDAIQSLPADQRAPIVNALPAALAGWMAAFRENWAEMAKAWETCEPTLRIVRRNSRGDREVILTGIDPSDEIRRRWKLGGRCKQTKQS
jgi:hypothetical protein